MKFSKMVFNSNFKSSYLSFYNYLDELFLSNLSVLSPIFFDQNLSSVKISSILIKPVGDFCNLACTYCYEEGHETKSNLFMLSMCNIERIYQDILHLGLRKLSIAWHGGEPTLWGINKFRSALSLQKTMLREVNVINSIQTNGVNLTEEWISFFKEENFSVGISLDGIESTHDYYRVNKGGSGSFKDVIKGIELLSNNEVPFGVIVVVSTIMLNKEREILELLMSLGVKNVDFHPNYGNLSGEKNGYISPDDYADFVINLHQEWYDKKYFSLKVNNFNEFYRYVLGGLPQTCYNAGTCSKIIAIDSNGDVGSCTRPFDKNLYTFGNLKQTNLFKIVNESKGMSLFNKEDIESQMKKKECKWFGLCHNGCPQHRGDKVDGSNIYCSCFSVEKSGNFKIYEYLEKHICSLFHTNKST